MRSDLFAADSSYNQLGLDTFELTYMQCDCPDWYDASTLYLNCKECSEFYVEPADPMLAFPQPFLVSRNIVRFYGVRIPGLNLPANRKFNEPNPPAATVFRYYGYEVLRPYKIWGSQMKRFLDPADTIMEDVKLTIR